MLRLAGVHADVLQLAGVHGDVLQLAVVHGDVFRLLCRMCANDMDNDKVVSYLCNL